MNALPQNAGLPPCLVCSLALFDEPEPAWNYCAQCGRPLARTRRPLGLDYRPHFGEFCVLCGHAFHVGACSSYREQRVYPPDRSLRGNVVLRSEIQNRVRQLIRDHQLGCESHPSVWAGPDV